MGISHEELIGARGRVTGKAIETGSITGGLGLAVPERTAQRDALQRSLARDSRTSVVSWTLFMSEVMWGEVTLE